MRHYCIAAALAALSACGGSGGSGVVPPANPNGPAVMGVNIPGGVVGRQFTANAASAEIDPATPGSTGTVFEYQAKLKFTSATQATLDPGTGSLIALTYDAMLGMFVDASGEWRVGVYNNINGETPTTDMLYFLVLNDPASGFRYVDGFVHGNRTAIAAMPITGTATYSGLTATVAGDGQQALGSFTLNADFAGSTVDGTLNGLLASDPTLIFAFVAVPINGNGFIGDLISVGNLTTVNAANSRINGRFFGPTAGEVGGTIVLDTAAGNAAGIFGGSTP